MGTRLDEKPVAFSTAAFRSIAPFGGLFVFFVSLPSVGPANLFLNCLFHWTMWARLGSFQLDSLTRGFKSHRNCFFDLLGVIFKLLIIPLQFQAAFVPYDSKEPFCK